MANELSSTKPKSPGGVVISWRLFTLDERDRLNPDHIKPFPAPDILAAHWVIAPDHVALCLGETRPVAVISPAWQLRFLSAHNPLDLILSLLPAVRTGHHMRTLLWPFIKKIALFHAHLVGPGPNHSCLCPLPSCLTPPLAGKSDA